ncbi:hypothetical protein [Thermus phage TSP4]|nr:hypothetical protein [Thermus phage TSP4]
MYFPSYLLVRPGEEFVWDIPDELHVGYAFMTSSGKLNGVNLQEASLEYGKRYLYEGNEPLVIAYYYALRAPYGVLVNEQLTAPLPDAGTVQRIHKKPSTYTSNGRVFFHWNITGKPVTVSMEWEKLDPYQAGASLGILLNLKGAAQVVTVPTDKVSVLLAGAPEVVVSVSEGYASMNWYASGTIPSTGDGST